MEEQNKSVEGEILSDMITPEWGDAIAGNSEDDKVYTADEVEQIRKDMQANGDRGVQKLLEQHTQENSFKDMVIDEITLVWANPERLLELSTDNPRVAQFILDKYYDGKSLEEYAELHSINMDENPKIQEVNIQKEAEKLYNKRVLNDTTEAFIQELQMTDEEQEEFRVAFEERKELKSFSMETMRSHLEKAYREIADVTTTDMKNAETLARATATGSGKDTQTPWVQSAQQKEVDALFQKFGL